MRSDMDFVMMNDIMKSWRWHFKVLKNEGRKENITDDPVYKRFLGLARQIKEICTDKTTVDTVLEYYICKRDILRDKKKGLPLRRPFKVSVAMELVIKACESLMQPISKLKENSDEHKMLI